MTMEPSCWKTWMGDRHINLVPVGSNLQREGKRWARANEKEIAPKPLIFTNHADNANIPICLIPMLLLFQILS
jgi:hypothetical protein